MKKASKIFVSSKALQNAIAKSGLSYSEFAEKAGISGALITKINMTTYACVTSGSVAKIVKCLSELEINCADVPATRDDVLEEYIRLDKQKNYILDNELPGKEMPVTVKYLDEQLESLRDMLER